MRNMFLAAFSVAALTALMGASIVSAESHSGASLVQGSMVGDRGGAEQTWPISLPADTDASVTLAFWPCLDPNAFQLDVLGPDGVLGTASQAGPCSRTLAWNTGEGGDVTLRMYNYLHNVPTNYSISATGFDLPGGAAPAMDAADTDEEAGDSTAADGEMESADTAETDTAADADVAEVDADAAESDGDEVAADTEDAGGDADSASGAVGTLLGNAGGAFATVDLPVKAGATYNLEMSRGLDVGGNWPAVGFKVWGPNGLVARSTFSYGSPAAASFTAAADDVYTVQIYNYHHGRTLFYALSVEEVAAAD